MIGRVANAPLSRVLVDGMARSQAQLVRLQEQLATGKRAATHADLGVDAVRTLSARTLLARENAQGAVAKAVDTTLALQDAHMNAIADGVGALRVSILKAAGTGKSAGLQQEIAQAFATFRGALNAREGGVALFGGGQGDDAPFAPATLAATAGLAADDAFRNDAVRATARVADGVDMAYGIGADEIGRGLFAGFRALAEAGPIGAGLGDADRATLLAASDLLKGGLAELGAVNADNGRRRAEVEVLAARSTERANLLTGLISRHEDADFAQIAVDLASRRTQLEASYSVFTQLSGLSLVRYLR